MKAIPLPHRRSCRYVCRRRLLSFEYGLCVLPPITILIVFHECVTFSINL